MSSKTKATTANSTGVVVAAQTIHGQADEKRIDEWELKAATRALMNLRELLYSNPMRELLRAQIDDSDRRMKQFLSDSNGEYRDTVNHASH